MKIAIGNDHVAVEYKREISRYIEEKYGYEMMNFGTDSTERFHYPAAGEAVMEHMRYTKYFCKGVETSRL